MKDEHVALDPGTRRVEDNETRAHKLVSDPLSDQEVTVTYICPDDLPHLTPYEEGPPT